MDRRQFFLSAGAVGAFFLAGCADSEAPPEGDDDGDLEQTGDDADENGDTDDLGDDDDDTEGEDLDEDGDDTDDDAENESSNDDDDDNGNGDTPRLEDVLAWESSYEMDYEFEGGSGHGVIDGADSYWTWTQDDETVESYRVDEEAYVVIDGQCFQETVETPDDELVEPGEMDDEFEEIRATGQTTVDGEEVWEFDIESGTYYISVETGYPVQFVDDGGGTVTFHSWGDVDPISPPDMDCEGPPENTT